ncbi:sigma-54-dependent Fis family transcriptional regulator [Aggregicoccus sp. 17bor-14]|uniref:sigma-54-dependent transcriptional regulator n=1 Tax=Myxococcaceae TaxID=31 RepID=UPI00129CA850|nr:MULTISPECIES: sigma-54 dependent transcriptional regulator [Myxococcaceae]MBF5044913.1 sigma-54-dependent Fis family transcriptional regulator [Simulacricoccus sp. 17bor-14]MRI90656.1 sigma-54-dependent Fis family transcriptional regulator [Aggregicoccus sp. 17bor-14]
MSSATVLVVDDDRANLDSVARIFQREGLATLTASQGQEALEHLRRPEVSVMVTDLMMPGMDGQELLRAARTIRPDVEVVLMTAYGTVETAVAAMKDGAYDFITKPLKRHALVKAVQKALEKQSLVAENRELKAKLAEMGAAGSRAMVGQSPAFRALMDTLRQAAPSSATVLLIGESGTGKELAARAVHELSPRARGPFVAINCAALPESILEAELFGVERGAFTGAVARKEGRFERASGGTLFLDEVGEMSPSAQVKLLRVLQEGEIERLGGTQTVRVDVRVVAATNKDLTREVAEGRFREDLYYRLNVVEVRIPALASRREDIPLLADAFLRRHAAKNGRALRGFSPEATVLLESYAWPGNVRELEHAVERGVVLAKGDVVEASDLPEGVRKGPRGSAGHLVIPIGTPMEEVERRVIHETLRHTKGDKTLAARLLGIAARTIYRKLERDAAGAEAAAGSAKEGSSDGSREDDEDAS